MPEETVAIARVPLARAPLRLVLPSTLIVVVAVIAGVAGILVGGWAGWAVVGMALLVGALGLYLAVAVVSVRLEVELASVRVRWFGGQRTYALARGPVTRVPVRGPAAVSLRPRFGALGWGMGPALLRDRERIALVRLAPTQTLILVPTDHGRLAIAPESERDLIAALSAAARVQQRLDEVTSHVPVLSPAPAEPRARPRAAEGRLMTGIERQLLEERLAAERAAALAAAEAERAAARMEAEAAPAIEAAPLSVAETVARVAESAPASAAMPAAVEERRGPRLLALPAWLQRPGGERALPIAFAALPALGAILLWVGIAIAGAVPSTDDELRPLALAVGLSASGAVGVVVALRWFPRLVGVVSISALFSLLLIGRALLG